MEYKFLADDFEFVGDKVDFTQDEIIPTIPAWKEPSNALRKIKGCSYFIVLCFVILAPIFLCGIIQKLILC